MPPYGKVEMYGPKVAPNFIFYDNRPTPLAQFFRSPITGWSSTIGGVTTDSYVLWKAFGKIASQKALKYNGAATFIGKASVIVSVPVYGMEMFDGLVSYAGENKIDPDTGMSGGQKFWHGTGWMLITGVGFVTSGLVTAPISVPCATAVGVCALIYAVHDGIVQFWGMEKLCFTSCVKRFFIAF